jgi:ribosomal-protein-alanine N-acetyltransferase
LTPPQRQFETDRLLFRPHRPKDESDYVDMQMDAEFRRYIGGSARSREDALRRFKGALKAPAALPGMWAIILKGEDRYAGYCFLRKDNRGVHLGYFIGRPYWHRGLGSEAVKGLLDFAKSQLHVSRILTEVEKGHSASERIMKKFGFNLVRETIVTGSERVICDYVLNL